MGGLSGAFPLLHTRKKRAKTDAWRTTTVRAPKKQGLTVRVRPWDLEKRIRFDFGLLWVSVKGGECAPAVVGVLADLNFGLGGLGLFLGFLFRFLFGLFLGFLLGLFFGFLLRFLL